MVPLKRTGNELRVTLRFDWETLALYRQLATRQGCTISDYLRSAIANGVMVTEAKHAIDAMREVSQSIQQGSRAQLSDAQDFELSMVYELVCEISRQRDPEAYQAMVNQVRKRKEAQRRG